MKTTKWIGIVAIFALMAGGACGATALYIFTASPLWDGHLRFLTEFGTGTLLLGGALSVVFGLLLARRARGAGRVLAVVPGILLCAIALLAAAAVISPNLAAQGAYQHVRPGEIPSPDGRYALMIECMGAGDLPRVELYVRAAGSETPSPIFRLPDAYRAEALKEVGWLGNGSIAVKTIKWGEIVYPPDSWTG